LWVQASQWALYFSDFIYVLLIKKKNGLDANSLVVLLYAPCSVLGFVHFYFNKKKNETLWNIPLFEKF
jgi:hypothetical protein